MKPCFAPTFLPAFARQTTCFLWALLVAALTCLGAGASSKDQPWRGVHLTVPDAAHLPLLEQAITNVLVPLRVNTLVLEVNYRFTWRTHPELNTPGSIGREEASELADLCRRNGIRLIPLLNCLGHQSWSRNTLPLLKQHPEFDETPQWPKDNQGIYCRSWCPLHPQVNAVVFSLMDELIEAFHADALHVGMDEVFLIASQQCPRCRGRSPARLFARAVSDYHRHLVKQRKVTMLMWADRLLDDQEMHYGEWESSRNKTAPAIDRIPKDIVLCDWHYELRKDYPSVPYFQKKGFRVWPSSWRNRQAALALLTFAREQDRGRVLGHLCTTWTGSEQIARALLGDTDDRLKGAREIVGAMRACLTEAQAPKAPIR